MARKSLDDEILASLNYTEWKTLTQVYQEIATRWEQEGRRSFSTLIYNLLFRKETYTTPSFGGVTVALHFLEEDGYVVSLEGVEVSPTGVPRYGYMLGKSGKRKPAQKWQSLSSSAPDFNDGHPI